MAKIPNQITTLNIVEMDDVVEDNPRGYLGMSGIASDCERKLWYGFHWVNPLRSHTQRIERIFNTGHIAESFVISDLKRIGCEVYRYGEDGHKIEMTGAKDEKQDECSDIAGHFKGHTDGNIIGVPEAPKTEHLLEIKTHNDKSFKDLLKNKVRVSKPVHYGQMQIYMHYRKQTRALYVAYNKNDSAYYFERVYYDQTVAEDLVRKAREIITSEQPPTKKFEKTWFACKWCDYKDICHGSELPAANCRTCEHGDIENEGKWSCGLDDKELDKASQLRGCEFHKFGWGLEN